MMETINKENNNKKDVTSEISDLYYRILKCNFLENSKGTIPASLCRLDNGVMKYEHTMISDEIKEAKKYGITKISELKKIMKETLESHQSDIIRSIFIKECLGKINNEKKCRLSAPDLFKNSDLLKGGFSYDINSDNLEYIRSNLLEKMKFFLSRDDYKYLKEVRLGGTQKKEILILLERNSPKENFFIKDIRLQSLNND